jgi:anti-sigma factor RsiW
MTDRIDERDALLAALLGPGEAELTCEECFDLLDRYVDLGETRADADRAVPGMRAHLAGCPACREDHESLRDLVREDATGPRAAPTDVP